MRESLLWHKRLLLDDRSQSQVESTPDYKVTFYYLIKTVNFTN